MTTIIATQPEYSTRLRDFLRRDHRLLIGGEWVASTGADRVEVRDPATGEVISSVVNATDDDVDRAVIAARKAVAARSWAGLAPAEREAVMRRFADLVEENADALAEIEAVDNGKPRWTVRDQDIPGGAAEIRYAAGWISKITGDLVTPALVPVGTYHAYSVREPVGVVAMIIPWNYPIAMALLKLAPALAAGCCIVIKPAEQTPLSALMLGELLLAAGVPPGVVNIVTGYGRGAGEALVRHRGVDKITFTGSTATGKRIMQQAAETLKRVTLELGGKSPVIVMPDFDPGAVAEAIAGLALANSGQLCVAPTRLYAHKNVFDAVVEGLAANMENVIVGPGLDDRSQLGPVVSAAQQDRVMDYVESARREGASLALGGETVGDEGYYIAPTLIADVNPDMRVVREEIFGPVLCVSRFEDVDRAIETANDTDYGLAASVWTHDLSTMMRMTSALQAGAVYGNCHAFIDPTLPVGGYKHSGFGRERGLAGILPFTELKTVAIRL